MYAQVFIRASLWSTCTAILVQTARVTRANPFGYLDRCAHFQPRTEVQPRQQRGGGELHRRPRGREKSRLPRGGRAVSRPWQRGARGEERSRQGAAAPTRPRREHKPRRSTDGPAPREAPFFRVRRVRVSLTTGAGEPQSLGLELASPPRGDQSPLPTTPGDSGDENRAFEAARAAGGGGLLPSPDPHQRDAGARSASALFTLGFSSDMAARQAQTSLGDRIHTRSDSVSSFPLHSRPPQLPARTRFAPHNLRHLVGPKGSRAGRTLSMRAPDRRTPLSGARFVRVEEEMALNVRHGRLKRDRCGPKRSKLGAEPAQLRGSRKGRSQVFVLKSLGGMGVAMLLLQVLINSVI